MPFKSEKQRKWMHANEPEMAKKWEKEESINEADASVIRKKLLKKFGEDPLYREFILAKTPKEQKKALKTLKSIRGGNAVRLMQKYVKKLQGESIKEKLRKVIRQEIKSINEIKTKDSKGKPIKPGELYYFTFIGAGRHKKPKVVKVIRNDAKGIVYHDFGDNSKYTIPMSLIKRKKMGGYFTLHESINEGFDKYHLGGLLDSKLKKRLERAIKIWGGKIDAVGDDYIKFRLSSFELKKFPALLKKLDRNKNVWIGDKRKNNIWDRRRNIDKLGESTNEAYGDLNDDGFKKVEKYNKIAIKLVKKLENAVRHSEGKDAVKWIKGLYDATGIMYDTIGHKMYYESVNEATEVNVDKSLKYLAKVLKRSGASMKIKGSTIIMDFKGGDALLKGIPNLEFNWPKEVR